MAPRRTKLGLATAVIGLLPPAALSVEPSTLKAHVAGGSDEKVAAVDSNGLIEAASQSDVVQTTLQKIKDFVKELDPTSAAEVFKSLNTNGDGILAMTGKSIEKEAAGSAASGGGRKQNKRNRGGGGKKKPTSRSGSSQAAQVMAVDAGGAVEAINKNGAEAQDLKKLEEDVEEQMGLSATGEQADTQGHERAEVGLQAGEVAADSDAKAMKNLQASLENDLGFTPTEQQKDAFQKMDSNGDGLVSFKEFQDSFVGDKEESAPNDPVSRDEFTAYENGKEEGKKKPGAEALAQMEAAAGAGKIGAAASREDETVTCTFGWWKPLADQGGETDTKKWKIKLTECVDVDIRKNRNQDDLKDDVVKSFKEKAKDNPTLLKGVSGFVGPINQVADCFIPSPTDPEKRKSLHVGFVTMSKGTAFTMGKENCTSSVGTIKIGSYEVAVFSSASIPA